MYTQMNYLNSSGSRMVHYCIAQQAYRTPLITPIVFVVGSDVSNSFAKLQCNEKHCTNFDSLCKEPSTMISTNAITIHLCRPIQKYLINYAYANMYVCLHFIRKSNV